MHELENYTVTRASVRYQGLLVSDVLAKEVHTHVLKSMSTQLDVAKE